MRVSYYMHMLFSIQIVRCFVQTTNILKLGMVYDPTTALNLAWRGYNYYAHLINTTGGLLVGMPGNQTAYMIQLIGHVSQDKNDPYWKSSGTFKYNCV